MIVIDNTVLSNFALVGHTEFIPLAFVDDIGTTESIFDEMNRGIILGRLPEFQKEWLQKISMTEDESIQFIQLCRHIDDGEASCLAVAYHRQWKMATDDKDARKWAVRLQIPHTGTLGILSVLIMRDQITLDEGNRWLEYMIEAGYRSPLKTLDSLIHQGESKRTEDL